MLLIIKVRFVSHVLENVGHLLTSNCVDFLGLPPLMVRSQCVKVFSHQKNSDLLAANI